MRRIIQLALLCGLVAASAACAASAQRGTGNMASDRAAPLQDDALRALLVDVVVAAYSSAQADDAPAEIFRANGTYQRNVGRGIAVEDWFEIRDGTVCVPNGGSPPRCRRVLANRDGTYTFIDAADGTSTVMTITRLQGAAGNRAGERAAPLQDDALRALLADVAVAAYPSGLADDAPAEIFRANGIYQRIAGRGSALGVRFEIRDGAVCVPNTGSAPLCRRIRPNPDGTYTFIDTTDGTSAVMIVTPLR